MNSVAFKVVRALLPVLITVFLISGASVPCFSGVEAKLVETPAVTSEWSGRHLGAPLLRDPIAVYNNWSSYDELSDNIELTEKLAMRELDELLRLRRSGVRFDYYMMDAFWFAKDGGYGTWRKPSWPNGPDAWIEKCQLNGVRPGLWFSTNTLVGIDAIPEWESSLNAKRGAMSFSEGGFLPNFMETMQYWYDRGIRMFKFDFVDFSAATPATEKKLSGEEIRARNENAFREALRKFRQKNPDVVLVAFNGFGGDVETTSGTFPFPHPVDVRWLEVFDSMYSGDPRPSDVPELNFWRSMDIYSDHMVRRYEQSYLPVERIDSTGFMVGNTGTIYYRKMNAWKGALILMFARGGWINTVHGNLELISDADARWFARVQSLYMHLQAFGRTKTFGGIPGEVQPYGFGSFESSGVVYTVVNPAQSFETIQLPMLTRDQPSNTNGKIIFHDAGFRPVLNGDRIKLGPGQMAVVAYGQYASPRYDLGIQEDVVIPRSIARVPAEFVKKDEKTVEAVVDAPRQGSLRIILQQHSPDGSLRRTWAGGPPKGTNMRDIFRIRAWQNGRELPVEINYDKVIWSGLSWAAGEVRAGSFTPGQAVTIQLSSAEKDAVSVKGSVYRVED